MLFLIWLAAIGAAWVLLWLLRLYVWDSYHGKFALWWRNPVGTAV